MHGPPRWQKPLRRSRWCSSLANRLTSILDVQRVIWRSVARCSSSAIQCVDTTAYFLGCAQAEVTHFFAKINVAVLKLSKTIQIGDKLHILGAHTDFLQEISSMQVDHNPVEEAEPGADVAIKVSARVRRGDKVYRLTGE